MAKIKTTKTEQSVSDFIKEVESETKRDDSRRLIDMMTQLTGEKPYMYGPGIVGFGSYHYKYASGHEGDAPLAGFSPRKAAISLYVAPDIPEKEKWVEKLGKCKAAVACIYIKKLDDIDEDVLKKMITASIKHVKNMYPS
ncbi:MAG TPA: DUF1801 domain-containing protein [Flavitalea sp.]|nr:DUF1801 domain-containing protein [Flavitalea sp.]